MSVKGVQLSFCPLLWRATGGAFDSEGHPAVPRDNDGNLIGNCDEAFECDACEIMQHELAMHPPGTVWWCCTNCVSNLKSRTTGRGLHLLLPGFYSEGYCQNPTCPREGTEDAAFSFLQLVIGDIRKESG